MLLEPKTDQEDVPCHNTAVDESEIIYLIAFILDIHCAMFALLSMNHLVYTIR